MNKKNQESALSDLAIALFFLFLTAMVNGQSSCGSPFAQMVQYTGGNISYATANSNGWCYNNLPAGSTYCFTYTQPASGQVEVDWQTNGCGSCGPAYVTGNMGCGGTGGGCSLEEYDQNCNKLWNGFRVGFGCPHVSGNVYTICFKVPSNCGGMSVCPMIKCASGCGGPLPIIWGYIGIKDGQIIWQTLSEWNNDRFEVEYSKDGINFNIFATIKAKNYPSRYSQYLEMEGYYRIRQVDWDGKFEFSKTLFMRLNQEDPVRIYRVSGINVIGQKVK